MGINAFWSFFCIVTTLCQVQQLTLLHFVQRQGSHILTLDDFMNIFIVSKISKNNKK